MITMKITIAVIFLLSTTLINVVNGETESSYDRALAVLECSEETGFDLENGKNLLHGDLSINTTEAQCFVRCIFKQEGYLNEKDEAQVNFIAEMLAASSHISLEVWTTLIEKCIKIESSDVCEAAFSLLKCIKAGGRGEKSEEEVEEAEEVDYLKIEL